MCDFALHNISIRRMPSIQRLHYSFNQNARLMCGNVNTLWNKQKISWLDISRTIKLQKWEKFGLMSGWLTSLFVPSFSATHWRLCFMGDIWNNKWQMIHDKWVKLRIKQKSWGTCPQGSTVPELPLPLASAAVQWPGWGGTRTQTMLIYKSTWAF